MYALKDYHYDLPAERIAQVPWEKRDESRLLRLERRGGDVSHHTFQDIGTLLKPGDLLVVNDTRVVPARLFGKKESGGRVEVLIVDYASGLKHLEDHGSFRCDCLVRASKSPKKGARLFLGGEIEARVFENRDGLVFLEFTAPGDVTETIKRLGKMPLPPYIKREEKGNPRDREDYQTVYAEEEGAVAAPTAGLHFTRDLLDRLERRGIEIARLTLHVGYGTFVPVRVDDIRDHQIHSEFFSLGASQAEKINRAKKEGRRVVAVGTTSVRTLEFLAHDKGGIRPGSGMCNLFIYPGYGFKIVDAMITNFHLPESTLIMLVSAFAGRKEILSAYRAAVEEKYRFFSYGDAMLIE